MAIAKPTSFRNLGAQRIVVGPAPLSKRKDHPAAAGLVLHGHKDKTASGEPANIVTLDEAGMKALESCGPLQALLKSGTFQVECR